VNTDHGGHRLHAPSDWQIEHFQLTFAFIDHLFSRAQMCEAEKAHLRPGKHVRKQLTSVGLTQRRRNRMKSFIARPSEKKWASICVHLSMAVFFPCSPIHAFSHCGRTAGLMLWLLLISWIHSHREMKTLWHRSHATMTSSAQSNPVWAVDHGRHCSCDDW
jgi:hypothetical protein